MCLEIHKLITSIWKKEKLPEEWKESIIVPIHKKRDKTDCNNYRGISLLPITYKILCNILLSRLIPYAVLYGCETWSLTLREERRLRVFENKVLRIFGSRRDEVTGEWRRLHNEELKKKL